MQAPSRPNTEKLLWDPTEKPADGGGDGSVHEQERSNSIRDTTGPDSYHHVIVLVALDWLRNHVFDGAHRYLLCPLCGEEKHT